MPLNEGKIKKIPNSLDFNLSCLETGIKYSLNIFIIQKLLTVRWCVVQWSIPELGMQLGGLGAEVLPHRIGALTTQRKGSTLKWKKYHLMINVYCIYMLPNQNTRVKKDARRKKIHKVGR